MLSGSKVLSVLLMCCPLWVAASGQDVADDPVSPVVTGKNVVPPPPPGPYISTALAENEQFVGGHGVATPPDTALPFAPDTPWPNHRMPQKWMPQEGYRFAPSLPERLSQQQASQPQAGNRMMPPRMMPYGTAASRQHKPVSRMSHSQAGAGRMHPRSQPMQPRARHRLPPAVNAVTPRRQMPSDHDGMRRPNRTPMVMPPHRGSQMPPDRRSHGKLPPSPRMNNRGMPGQMQRHAMPQRNAEPQGMPPPPRGPWLPLGNYPAW